MEDKLKSSFEAFRKVLKEMDREKLNQIIDKVNNIEPKSNRFIVSEYFKELENEYCLFYSSKNYFAELTDVCQYDNISVIDNEEIEMKFDFNSHSKHFEFKIFLNGEMFNINNFNNIFEENEALVA